nr:MAG TPA: hypothetical protein [Bacteriophage sp.]
MSFFIPYMSMGLVRHFGNKPPMLAIGLSCRD